MIPNEKPKDVLSEEQKKFINDNFEKLELNELSKQTWNDPKADMRSLRGKAVRLPKLGQSRTHASCQRSECAGSAAEAACPG